MQARIIEPMTPAFLQIKNIWKDTHDTFSLKLATDTLKDGFKFAAGQFNMLSVFGVGEVPISISGNPADSSSLIHTTRAVGTVTKAMRNLRPKDFLGVRGPYGKSWPIEIAQGKDIILIAGGIGLAPLRPNIYHIMANRGQYRNVVLLYGDRTPQDILYEKELQKWRSRLDMEVYITVDRASGQWHGNIGVVTTLIHKAPFEPQNTIAMICGPEIMMRFTVRELQKRGVQAEQIYISMERNMKCGIGLCGHCQYGPTFICKDGPVYRYDALDHLLSVREL